jgi:dGTPase
MHDLGHPPFGHAGEDALNERLAAHGGFNHNRQALRIVETLETRYPNFPGLNLSREVLAGQQSRAEKRRGGARSAGRLLEAQVVDAADSIAYNAHDADDAVELELLELVDLDASALWQTAGRRAGERYAALDDEEFRRAAVHEVIDVLVSDLVHATSRRLAEVQPASTGDVLGYDHPLVAASAEMAEQQAELQRLLLARVYRHPALLDQRAYAAHALGAMFERLLAEPARLPAKFAAIGEREGLPRAAADFIAGMTDRYALETHEGWFREIQRMSESSGRRDTR